MSKITAYAALTTVAAGDVLPVVDISDTSMASSGTTKKIAVSDLTALTTQLDSNSADIQTSGTVSAGSSTLAARADHVHPNVGLVNPTDVGVITWTMDPANAGGGSGVLVSGQIYLAAFWVRKTVTIANMAVAIQTAGTTLTTGQNFAGIYNAAGTQVGVTADQTATWGGGVGTYDMALTASFSASAGQYWAALLSNATTCPNFRGSTPAITLTQVGQSAATSRFGRFGTAQTTLPGSITPASIAQASAFAFCAVLH